MLEAILNFFLAHSDVGYIFVFFAAFLESIAFLGILVPGTVIVLFSGFLAEQWPLSFDVRVLMVLVALGCFFGAVTSYLLGRFYGPPFFSDRSFFLKRQYLVRAQQYFAAYGGKSIFSGNFLGPLRSLVPFVAGMSEMGIWRFIFWSASASAVWSFLFVGLGYFLGASWEAVELWGTRLTVFLFGLAVVIVLNWLVGRFLVRHERQVRAFLLSISRSVISGLAENEYIANFIERHPRFIQFMRKRFSPYEVLGLSFSFSLILSVVILGYLLVLIHAVVVRGPLIELDNRLLELVMFVRDPIINRLMLYATNLAGWPVLGFMAALSVFLLWRRSWLRLMVFLIGAASASGAHFLLKMIFDRPRPNAGQALILASSASFPSGHAIISFVFYGFLAYVIVGYVRSWRTKIAVVLSAVFVIGLVGVSRIYLGVHWPSDVLGGYLLGAWWLVGMITVIYLYENFISPVSPAADRTRPLSFLTIEKIIVAAAIAAAVWFYWFYTAGHPLQTIVIGEVEILSRKTISELTIQELNSLNKTTETLRGRTQTPVNIIVVGSRQEFEKSFRGAGWQIADPATIDNIIATVRSSLANTAYPAAPISPSFYSGRVQDIGVEKETSLKSARQRHHARFWLAPLVLADGTDVWLGTASFDNGVAYSPVLKFPTHTISPDIDSERDFIRDDLFAVGFIAREEEIVFNEPTLGTSGVGAPFFTDGRVRVLWLKN